MKINIRNKSDIVRTKSEMDYLKIFTAELAWELGIACDVREIRLRYRNWWYGYYPKGKPLAGFYKLFKAGIVTIDLTGHWDADLIARKTAIVHELTHVKQIVEKRLRVHSNCRVVHWNGSRVDTWKKYRESIRDSLTSQEARRRYKGNLIPWEWEVWENVDKLI